MSAARFREEQDFHFVVYIVMLVVFGGIIAAAVVAFRHPEEADKAAEAWWVLLLAGLGFLVATNVFRLRTVVRDDELYVRFGYFFPMYWKRIPLSDVRDVRAVEYRPLRDAGGWGIRFGRFESEKCRFLNARGNRGVLVQTTGKRWIIGSQKPEALCAALQEALAKRGAENAG
jgi:hypothetical protein